MSFFHRRLFRGRSSGFTLVELIAVLAVLAVLVLIAVPGYVGYTRRAYLVRLQADGRLLYEASIRYYGHHDDWPVIRPALSDEELAGVRVFDLKLMSWGDLSELRVYIAEKEGKDPSEINFYRLDGEKLKPYVLVRSSLDSYVFRNPAGELYILDPYSMPSSAGDGGTSRGPLREPAEGEIVIRTAEELAKIGRDPSYPLNAKYILKSNIDLSGYMSDGGWQPIGDLNNPFTGIFDGNGYTIKNLYINRPDTHYQGLFGYTRLAKVSNVTLESVSVTGYDYTGALAGYIYKSMISGSSSSGTVAGRQHVGGLLGMNDYYSELVFSYSTADITGIGSSRYTGGLVGTNYRGSYIRNCYAAGSVTGNSEVGGLVGLNSNGRVVGSNLEKSYSTGSVTGGSRVGGLVGYNYGSMVTGSYWDTETSGLATSAGGTGRTTAEMKQQSTFVDWDFDTVWQIDEGETYPYLRSNPQSPPPM
ncbi:Fimbrial protein [Koleobacter methoxysyntrophicus]|uniref:Fimbrial protein n=1 Tax=Koleobacter methoxysyntrophicus TaxID=2751313 RepID=A0A8A0RRN5_9FIRM|nr:GLUG motif-containing protein [Koleobacter methoxysyntrophicus]QSQ10562.1 Fimbrial protein [Koleobacter methoxysyntrophicus]